VPFDRDSIPALALSYDLATTEATFLQLAGPLPDEVTDASTNTSTSTSASASSGTDPDMWKFIGYFKVNGEA
jgi:hypothetical protein